MARTGLVAWVLAGALVGSAGLALAADTATTTPDMGKAAQTAKTPAKAATAEKHRTVRGELTVVQPDSLTVKMEGKHARMLTLALSDRTKVHEGKATKSVSDLKVGERVAIRYTQSAAANTAVRVNILREAPKQG
jgi:hypothetical protein